MHAVRDLKLRRTHRSFAVDRGERSLHRTSEVQLTRISKTSLSRPKGGTISASTEPGAWVIR